MELHPPPEQPGAPGSASPGPRPRSTRRRFAYALAGALVAHGLIALVLLTLPSHPPARLRTAAKGAVEIRLESAPAKSAPAAAPSAEASVSGAPVPARAPARVAPLHPAAPARSDDAPLEAALVPAPAQGSAERAPATREHDAAWAAAEGLGPARTPPFGVSRTLQDPLAALGPSPYADRPGAGSFDNGFGQGPQGPVHVPSREEALAEEKARVESRVKGWIVDDMAVARANRDGDRDGYWQDVQDVLEKGFAPDWSLLEAHHGNQTSPAPKAVRVLVEQYAKMTDAYGKTGSPFPNKPGAPGAPGVTMNQDLVGALSADRGLRGTVMDSQAAQVLQLQNLGGGEASPWLQRLVVHLLLTQRPDGGLEDVSIAGSSGNPVYDALALGQARSLSAHGLLGAPPKDHRKTIWAFEADFEQLPPMPVAGCRMGDNFLPSDCFYPFKKSVKSRVRLEAVY